MRLCRNLLFGAEMSDGVLESTNQDKIFAQYQQRAQNNNALESLRTGQTPMAPQKFLIDAYQRHQRIAQ